MTVHCPHCATGYLLPDHLLGPRGARVRCPQCKRPFVVLREEAGGTSTRLDDILPAEAEAPAPDPAQQAEAARVAEELLDSLAEELGRALDQARSRGRVLAEFGPDVMRAFDQYRSRLGERAAPAAFRAALKERWGVDLTT